jgi:2-oxoisovalerate ferredoxin oxidoreductase gamma subunit
MKEIRWHGRGGQGAVIGARVLATAFVKEGKSAMAVPKFGAERRGAPVVAFTGFNDQPIREKTQLYHPDCLIVIDPLLMRSVDVFQGIKEGGILVIDKAEPVTEQYDKNLRAAASVEATTIGLEEIGRPITNTSMLGAFVRATDWVQLDSILSSLEEYFTGTVLQKNIRCAQRGYEEAKITKF